MPPTPLEQALLVQMAAQMAEAAGDAAEAAAVAHRTEEEAERLAVRLAAVEARAEGLADRLARVEAGVAAELAASQRAPAVVVAHAIGGAICRIPGWQVGIVAILVALTGAAAIVPSSLPLIVGALHDLYPSRAPAPVGS